MKCSFDEKIDHPDGSFIRTTCINQATIFIVSDPCYGLCYLCAYQKLRADAERNQMNNAEKIRELLKETQPLTFYPGGDLLKQVLALLPCETCADTERVPIQVPPNGDMDFDRCPDCKEKV